MNERDEERVEGKRERKETEGERGRKETMIERERESREGALKGGGGRTKGQKGEEEKRRE